MKTTNSKLLAITTRLTFPELATMDSFNQKQRKISSFHVFLIEVIGQNRLLGRPREVQNRKIKTHWQQVVQQIPPKHSSMLMLNGS